MEVQFKFMGPTGGTGNPASPPPQSYTALEPPNGGPWKINRITGRAVDSIDGVVNQMNVVWESTNGGGVTGARPIGGTPFAGDGATDFDIPIDAGDFLTFVQVFTGNVVFPPQGTLTFDVVRGLVFRTPKRSYNIVGAETSDDMIFEAPAGSHIVGFFGLEGGLIDALGVYIQSIPSS